MATTMRTTAAKRVSMDRMRKTALVAGGLYLITFIAGIPPALVLYSDVLNNPAAFIMGSGNDTAVLWGGLLELINALACIGTAVVLFPVVKRQSEAAALGFVTSRMFEAAVIVIGIVSLLSVVTLRQDLAGAPGTDAAALVTTGHALVAIYDWALLLGPGVMPAVNALLLGYLMYRSGLVPRLIPMMGLIGAPLLLASSITTMFGHNEQVSVLSVIAVIPIFFWELSLGVYMLVRASGHHRSPLPLCPRPRCSEQSPSPDKQDRRRSTMASPTNTAPRDRAGTTSPANDRDNDTAAATLSVRRLNLMRLGYLVMGAGIAVTKWPLLIDRNEPWPLFEGVATYMLVAMGLLAFLGLRYPVKLLPILLFESAWKLIWLTAVALPLWTAEQMDSATSKVASACLWVVIVLAVIPWRYVVASYITKPGDPWRSDARGRSEVQHLH